MLASEQSLSWSCFDFVICHLTHLSPVISLTCHRAICHLTHLSPVISLTCHRAICHLTHLSPGHLSSHSPITGPSVISLTCHRAICHLTHLSLGHLSSHSPVTCYLTHLSPGHLISLTCHLSPVTCHLTHLSPGHLSSHSPVTGSPVISLTCHRAISSRYRYIMAELLQTERTYVKDIENCIKVS